MCDADPTEDIGLIFRRRGFDPNTFEFNSSAKMKDNISLQKAQSDLKTYIGRRCKIAVCVGADYVQHVFDVLTDAGEEFGLGHGGYFAINSLRMEKGYRHWGHDIGEEDTPMQAGLSFAVGWDKDDFRGRTALLRARDQKPQTRRVIQLKVAMPENPRLLYHEEPILRDGEIVGSVTSGGLGHRIGASLGMGYVKHEDGVSAEVLNTGQFEIDVALRRDPVSVQFKGVYDPQNDCIRG